MPRKSKKRILLAVIESVYAVDAVPVGAANAIETEDLQVQPLQGNTASRNVDRPISGASRKYHTNPHQVISFKVALAGSGVAGNAPAYGVLLQACGMSETATVGTDVVYNLIDALEPSLTLYINIDGILHKAVGAHGTVKLTYASGNFPMLDFTFTALHMLPSDVAAPAVDLTAFQVPLPVNSASTSTFNLAGHSGVLHDCSIDLANAVTARNLPNDNRIVITDRDPSGSITIDEPLLAVIDFYSLIESHASNVLTLTHGNTAGHIIDVSAPAVQLTSPSHGDADGIATLQMSMGLLPLIGNDELVLTIR